MKARGNKSLNFLRKQITSAGWRLVMALPLSMGLVWSPIAFAVEVQLKRGIQFRQVNEERTEETALLKAGSVVDIPDQFRMKDESGNFSAELTVNNWLRTAGRVGVKEEHRAGGVIMRASDHLDYYYPVHVLKAAPGSTLSTYKGKTYFLALRMLKRKNDDGSNKIVTREDTRPAPVEEIGDQNAAPAKPTARTQTEAKALCLDGTCHERTQSPAFDRLVRDLSPALRSTAISETKYKNRTADDMRALAERFEETCGFSLSSFIPIIKQRSEAAGIPADIMMSIMVQESSGRCFAAARNRDSSRDSGLFGVNSGSSHVRACLPNDIRWIRNARASDLPHGPQCKENPYVNLNLAISILKAKADGLSRNMNIRGERYGAYDERKLVDKNGNYNRFAWRLAVSAYNGGERWVMKAKSDLEEFNRKNHTQLDPYNWEDLRIFYLRNNLDEDRESQYFNYEDGNGRAENKTIANLAYIENVVPYRNGRQNDARPINEYWRTYFARVD